MTNELKLRSLEELEGLVKEVEKFDVLKDDTKSLMNIIMIFIEEGEKNSVLTNSAKEVCDVLSECKSFNNMREITIAEGCNKIINDIAKIIIEDEYKEFYIMEKGGMKKFNEVIKALGDRTETMYEIAGKVEDILVNKVNNISMFRAFSGMNRARV